MGTQTSVTTSILTTLSSREQLLGAKVVIGTLWEWSNTEQDIGEGVGSYENLVIGGMRASGSSWEFWWDTSRAVSRLNGEKEER